MKRENGLVMGSMVHTKCFLKNDENVHRCREGGLEGKRRLDPDEGIQSSEC